LTIANAETTSRMSLRNVLFANATFSLISAAILIAASGSSAEFLGTVDWVPTAVGVALLGWAAFVFLNARREQPTHRDTWLTITGDLAWVVGAVVIILLPDSLSTGGKWALGIVSLAVLDFAVFQWMALRRGS
jgi:hypothetical protein